MTGEQTWCTHKALTAAAAACRLAQHTHSAAYALKLQTNHKNVS